MPGANPQRARMPERHGRHCTAAGANLGQSHLTKAGAVAIKEDRKLKKQRKRADLTLSLHLKAKRLSPSSFSQITSMIL